MSICGLGRGLLRKRRLPELIRYRGSALWVRVFTELEGLGGQNSPSNPIQPRDTNQPKVAESTGSKLLLQPERSADPSVESETRSEREKKTENPRKLT